MATTVGAAGQGRRPQGRGVMIVCSCVCVGVLCLWSFAEKGNELERFRTRREGEKFFVTGVQRRNDVQFGSAPLEGAHRGKWFAGHFMPTGNLLQNENVELKWSDNKAGTTNGDVAVNKQGHSMCILIQGKHLLDFGDEQVLLENRGDYVVWGPGVPHTWTSLTSTTVLTIRWPSLAGDQNALQNASSLGFK